MPLPAGLPVFDWALDLGSSSLDTQPTSGNSFDGTPFGDGYVQVDDGGLNPLRDVWSVVMTNVDHDIYLEIKAFMRPKLAARAVFAWAPPGDDDPRAWMCNAMQCTPTDHRMWTLNMRFVEWHQP
jgi:phage-related protein